MLISRRGLALSVVGFLWLSAPSAPVCASSATSAIYTYTDDSGVQNFTTELGSIPEQYRSRVTPLEHDISSTPPPIVPSAQRPPSARVRVVTASGEYRMGDHDTRGDAVRVAVEAAKRDALEQVATYLESVTDVTSMDVTRDEIRSYTAGIVMVVDQKISTWLEVQTVVIRADLTAQVDPDEVVQAIKALRENESAKTELAALRAETDQLHQQLDEASRALATAVSPEEVQRLNQDREDLLNQLQTNALMSQAWTDWVYVTPVVYPSPWIGLHQVRALLLQAQHLYPRNRHLPMMQQLVATQAGTLPPALPGGVSPVQPHASLLVPPPPQTLLPGSSNAATGAYAFRAPAAVPSQPFSRPLPPTLQQVHPPHVAQPQPPVLRAPYSVPQHSHSGSSGHFGGRGGGHFSGGGHSGGGGQRGR